MHNTKRRIAFRTGRLIFMAAMFILAGFLLWRAHPSTDASSEPAQQQHQAQAYRQQVQALKSLVVKLHAYAKAAKLETIMEDDPRWDCETMGNLICGPIPPVTTSTTVAPEPYSGPDSATSTTLATTPTTLQDDDQTSPPDEADWTPPTTLPWAEVTTTTVPPTTTTTTLAPVPTTTTTLPPAPAPTVPRRPSNLGAFLQGWNTPATDLPMQQTYVRVCGSYIEHRISQMRGNAAFVYVETPGNSLQDTIDGTLDACWRDVIARIPSGAIFAPLAEANGTWVDWYTGSAAEYGQAMAHVAALDGGRHVMCSSLTIMGGSRAYLAAAAPYVQRACPSHYTWSGASAATLGAQARSHAASAGLPLIWAQGGTLVGTAAEKAQWAVDAANAVAPSIFIYFNANGWAIDSAGGGWPW